MHRDYLRIEPHQLVHGQTVKVVVVKDAAALARHMAEAMFDELQSALTRKGAATVIVPVGPIDQFPLLAQLINERRLACREVAVINMDEYLDERDHWLPEEHPLSFRSFMKRSFYDLLDSSLAPAPQNRIFPDPQEPALVQKTIDARGGVDVCFGGIGINGHIAFNEPPEPEEKLAPEQFVQLPTRIVDLARETRTINSVTVGGELAAIPKRAITVGMREILASQRLRFYCNRPWQKAVVRRVLHGPVTPLCPASYLRTHPDASLVMTEEVAAVPEIKLR